MKPRAVGVVALLLLAFSFAFADSVAAADASSPWVVTWRGAPSARGRSTRVQPSARDYSVRDAAEELARRMSEVLQAEVRLAPWEETAGQRVFLVAEGQYAPEEVRQSLRGKQLDAFVIRYPCRVDGRETCVLASRDSAACAFPVYEFLRKHLGVEWVGPGDIGRIAPPRPDWRMPDKIDVLENPDYEHRAWKAAGAIPALYFRVPDLGFLTVRNYPHALADIIRLTHDLGGFGFYAETATNWAAGGPKMVVLARLLWDTSADVDQLLDRYMRRAFGRQAAPHVRAYFDRWEEIWERGRPDLRWNTTRCNKFRGQLDELTRADLEAMDAAIERASEAPATPSEKKRLEYVAAYYRWLRPNADQYVLARELSDEGWVAARTAEQVLGEAERGLELTGEFNRQWETVISRDQTGWLLSRRAAGDAGGVWRQFVEPVRDGVLAAYENGVDEALNRLTQRMLSGQTKAGVEEFWRAQILHRPKLAPWAKTQLRLLQRGPGENLVANGDFERGKPGPPPAIPGWTARGAWQGVATQFAWRAGSGRRGDAAAAIGKGRIGQLGAVAPVRIGRRYRLSFWRRTDPDLNPAARVFLHGLPAGRLPLERTGGSWRRWTTTFTAPRSRITIIFEVRGADRGEWVWLDDVQLVEIGGE